MSTRRSSTRGKGAPTAAVAPSPHTPILTVTTAAAAADSKSTRKSKAKVKSTKQEVVDEDEEMKEVDVMASESSSTAAVAPAVSENEDEISTDEKGSDMDELAEEIRAPVAAPTRGTKRGRPTGKEAASSSSTKTASKKKSASKLVSEPPSTPTKSTPSEGETGNSSRRSPRVSRRRQDLEFVVDNYETSEEEEEEDEENDGEVSEAASEVSVKSPKSKSKVKSDESEGSDYSGSESDDDDDDEDYNGGRRPRAKSPSTAGGKSGAKTKRAPASPSARKPRTPKAPKSPRVKKAPKAKVKKAPKPGAKKRVILAPLLDEPDLLKSIEACSHEFEQVNKSMALDTSCCTRCASKEAFRAVKQNNLKLVESICDNYKELANPFIPWSSDCSRSAIFDAIRLGDKFVIRRLLHELNIHEWANKQSNHYYHGASSVSSTQPKAATDKEPAVRVPLPTCSLSKQGTGQASYIAYGHRVAQVNLSRGGKEGNNAFTYDPSDENGAPSFQECFVELLKYGKNPDLIEVFAQTIDPQRTSYEHAIAQMKPSKPALKKVKTKDPATAAADALLLSANGNAAAAPIITIHTREDEVHRILSQSNGFYEAVSAGNLVMARAAYAFSQKRSGAPGLAASTSASPFGGHFSESRMGGFNFLHGESLQSNGKPFSEQFKSISVTKKAGGNFSITPVHLACINPDTQYLKALSDVLGVSALLQVTDDHHRTPVHFAAVCSSPEPLKWLIANGANIFVQDRQQKTPLEFAVLAGAAHNIPVLVPQIPNNSDEAEAPAAPVPAPAAPASDAEHDDDGEGEGEDDEDEDAPRRKKAKKAPALKSPAAAKKGGARGQPVYLGATKPHVQSTINLKHKKTGNTLFHTACGLGDGPVVKALLEAGADIFALDKEKRTGLVFACQQGHLEIVKVLYQWIVTHFTDKKELTAAQKKQFLALDKFHRLPIFHAVKNGHFELVKYLLVEVGLPVDAKDSSDNSLLHYASAYGWSSIVKLILAIAKHYVDDDSITQLPGAGNIWKTTSLFIAMLKGHLGPSRLVLNSPGVDVNARDSDGLTILHHVIRSKDTNLDQCLQQINFLRIKKADFRLQDPKTHRNVLHMLCQLPYVEENNTKEKDVELADIFLSEGVEVNEVDDAGQSPMMLALKSLHFPLVQHLLTKGSRVNLSYSLQDKYVTPLMCLLTLTRPKTKDEEKDEQEIRQLEQQRPGYGWGTRSSKTTPTAEEQTKKDALAAKSKALDAIFESKKDDLFRQMLENGAKYSDVINDPVVIELKEGETIQEEKKANADEEDHDYDEEDEDMDEYDDDGEERKQKDSKPIQVVTSVTGSTKPNTLHYLNGRDATGLTLLSHCVRSSRALELIRMLFQHSAELGQNYALDLGSRDSQGKNILFHAIESVHAVELIKLLLDYANGKVSGSKKKFAPSPISKLDLNSVTKTGETLFSTILSRTYASTNPTSPIKAFRLIQSLVESGFHVSSTVPIIRMHRKAKAPPNPPPIDPAHPDKIPVKFEWDIEDIHTGKLLLGVQPGESAHYTKLRTELPHYDVEQESLLQNLLGAYFSYGRSRMSGRPIERVQREHSAFLQIISLVLQDFKKCGPSVMESALTATSYALPKGNVLHQIFSNVRVIDLAPLLQLVFDAFPNRLLRQAGSMADKNGCTPLLVLANSALPLAEPSLIQPKQMRYSLQDLLKIDIHSWKESDDIDTPATTAPAAASSAVSVAPASSPFGGGFMFGTPQPLVPMKSPASRRRSRRADSDEEMNEDDEDGEGDEDGEDDGEDENEDDEDEEMKDSDDTATTAAAVTPAAVDSVASAIVAPVDLNAPKLVVAFVLAPADVCQYLDHYLKSSSTSIDEAISKKWHDPATLKRRPIKANGNKPKPEVKEEVESREDVDMDSDYDSADDTDTVLTKGSGASVAPQPISLSLSPAVSKPPCQYGDRCYRKNPQHAAEFSHPRDLLAAPAGLMIAAAKVGDEVSGSEEGELIIPEQKNLYQTFLHLAVFHRSVTLVKHLVLTLKANVLATDYKQRIPLFISCEQDSANDVIPKLLLSTHAEDQVSHQNLNGAHALILVAQHTNKLPLAQLLLQTAPAKQIHATDHYQRAALHYAVNFSGRRHGNESARGYELPFAFENLLLDHAADINSVDIDGRSCLHYVFVEIGQVYSQSSPGHATDPIELVSDISAVTDPNARSKVAPAQAANAPPSRNLSRAQSFIHKVKGTDCFVKVDVRDIYGRTPIMYAAQIGAQISVKYLLQRGASLRTIDSEGNGIFQHALVYKHMSLAVDLIDHDVSLRSPIVKYTQHLEKQLKELDGKAEPEEVNKILDQIAKFKIETTSTFGYVLQQNWIGLGYLMMDAGVAITSAVKDALSNSLLSLVFTLLSKTPTHKLLDVDPATGRNLFHIIASYYPKDGQAREAFNSVWAPKWCAMLLAADVDVNAQDEVYHQTPLYFACIHNHTGLIKFFLQQKVRCDVVGLNGYTPLLLAARQNHFEAIKLLHQYDPKLFTNAVTNGSTQAKDGTTVLHWAISNQNFLLTHYLLQQKGVDVNPILKTTPDKFDPTGKWIQTPARISLGDTEEDRGKNFDALKHHRATYSRYGAFRRFVSWSTSSAQYLHPLSPLQMLCTPIQQTSFNWDLIKLLLAFGAKPDFPVLESDIGEEEFKSLRGPTLLMYLNSKRSTRLFALLLHELDPVEVEAEKKRLALVPVPPAPLPTQTQLAIQSSHVARSPNNTNLTDSLGQTMLHRLVIPFGPSVHASYEDGAALRQFVLASRNGKNIPSDLEAKDKFGRTAIYYAYQQASGCLAKVLLELGAQPDKVAGAAARAQHIKSAAELSQSMAVPLVNWSAFPTINDQADADEMVAKEEARLAALMDAPTADAPTVKVDSNAGDLCKTCVVFKDPVLGLLDLEMVCTEVNAGYYGKHSFYRMQVLHNALQNLPILWTRWGRVGETGQFQQTPFSTMEQAVAEFCKIFKSKSGNNWETQRTPKTFVKIDNKYHLQFSKSVNAMETLLVPLDTILARNKEIVPPISVTPLTAQSLIKLLCDVSFIHQTIQRLGYSSGVDEQNIAGKLTRAYLEEAYSKLKRLAEIIPEATKLNAELQTLRSNKQQLEYRLAQKERELAQAAEKKDQPDSMEIDDESKEDEDEEMDEGKYDDDEKKSSADATSTSDEAAEIQAIDVKIADITIKKTAMDDEMSALSNAFFQLIPQPSFRSSAIRAINTMAEVQKFVTQVLQFLELHVTKKLLIGCQLNPSKLNPIDYIYSGLGISLNRLRHADRAYELIQKYVYASGQRPADLEIYNIFELTRRGEAERFEPFAKADNRTLLWHGSSLVNFNGILSQGLRIAPPEADVSGYAFGKGVYFADSFAKSYGYCRDVDNSGHTSNNQYYGYQRQQQQQQHQDEKATKRSKLLLLCEVALGRSYEAHTSEYMETNKPGTLSTKAIGMQAPDPTQTVVTNDGLRIPNGDLIPVPIPDGWKPEKPAPAPQNYHCTSNNEFIIYNGSQCRMRYLVHVGPPRPKYIKYLARVANAKLKAKSKVEEILPY